MPFIVVYDAPKVYIIFESTKLLFNYFLKEVTFGLKTSSFVNKM